jgi:hypothetical protein
MASIYRYPNDPKIGQFMVFSQYRHNKTNNIGIVAIATPTGFTISDGAGYGNIDLGIIGEPAVQQALGDKTFDKESLKGAIASGAKGDDTEFIIASVAANNGFGGTTGSRIAAQTGVGGQKAFNPNTVVMFNNMELRSYQFQFTAVPTSEKEWKDIKGIIDTFRLSMYPDKIEGSILLNYPDQWKFSFESSAGRQIPKSYDCYLTAMSTSYNTLGNAWRPDGAPTDVAITLTFQETKALHKEDIRDLNKA